MTARTRLVSRTGSRMLGVFSAFLLLLTLRNADVAAEGMRNGLLLSVRAVIPSLFPALILSEILITSGAAERLFALPARLVSPLLGLSSAGGIALLLGLACGFPAGPRAAVLAFDRGKISQWECERLIALASLPSPAFLIGTVGGVLLGDRGYGIRLLTALLLATLIAALLFRTLRKKDTAPFPSPFPLSPPSPPPARLFTDAIRAATERMLSISAYVIFFSALLHTLSLLLAPLHPSETALAVLHSFFELSAGTAASAELPRHAALLVAVASAWSGLSVHCQLLSLRGERALSLLPYLVAKLMLTLLTPLFLIFLTLQS